jgi:hypothetical protein
VIEVNRIEYFVLSGDLIKERKYKIITTKDKTQWIDKTNDKVVIEIKNNKGTKIYKADEELVERRLKNR